MTIQRTPHKFDNLNWIVSVISEDEPFLNLKGQSTSSFNFCSIPENKFYFVIPESYNYIDQALQISSIQTKFNQGPHKDSLAPIPATSFSISNLDLFYHKLCEINGGDLNVFAGAKVQIWMNNSLNPLGLWDNASGRWYNYNNTYMSNIFQSPDPTILTPNYPTNESGNLVFTGTIEDIEFSTETTSFNCLGISDRQNTELGTLVDPLAMKKNRGGILPITFGNWSSEEDLIPVILNRNQNDIPKIILGEYPHKRIDGVRLYDKISERDFKVTNKFSVTTQFNEITFKSDQVSATLGTSLPEDKSIYYEVSQIGDLRDELFPDVNNPLDPNQGNPATNQTLFSVDEELIAFHSPTNKPDEIIGSSFGNVPAQKSASRGWGDQPAVSHQSTSELFEVDQDYQKAIALIEFTPKILGFYWGGKSFQNISQTGGVGVNTGNFWNVIRRESMDETDSAPDFESFQLGGGINSGSTPEDFFSLEFEKIGFEGQILKTTFENSFWWFSGGQIAGNPAGSIVYKICIRNPNVVTDSDWFEVNIQQGVIAGGPNVIQWSSRINSTTTGVTPPYFDPQRWYKYDQSINPFIGWQKIKMAGNFTTQNLTTIEEINSGRLGINSAIVQATSQWDQRLFLDFIKFKFEAKVDAESGLWFCQGLGRVDSSNNLITTSVGAIKDIFTKELKLDSTKFGTMTTKRSSWTTAFSIFGKQKDWRKVLKGICSSYGMGSFQSRDGKENLIDYDLKTPDWTISPDQVLLAGDTQAINYSFTDREDLFNEFLIKFRKSPANKDTQAVLMINETEKEKTGTLEYFTLATLTATQAKIERASKRLGLKNGEKKRLTFDSEFIRDLGTAEKLLQLLVLWNTSTKAIVKVSGTYSDFFDFNVGDQVIFEANKFGGLPRKIAESQYLVTGTTINPANDSGGSIDLDLIEIPTQAV